MEENQKEKDLIKKMKKMKKKIRKKTVNRMVNIQRISRYMRRSYIMISLMMNNSIINAEL